MVGPIQNPPARPALTQRNRGQRFSLDLAASVAYDEAETAVRIQDISESGVALLGEPPALTNEQFLDLHIEGHKRLQGRVVRQFAGGYAMQFDGDTGPAISEQELADFRKKAASGG
ncbi:MAG: PilZ domain-containing protein [Rhodospirillales bacterium]|nr:PilZ domain-containing protein [Rhodospirillales bacterium]